MNAKKLVSIFAAATMLISSVPVCAQAAAPSAVMASAQSSKLLSAKASAKATDVYTAKKMPYNYNATMKTSATLKGKNNINSTLKIYKGTRVCIINAIKVKNTVLYETFFTTGHKKTYHAYLSAGTVNFRYQSGYTSSNRQPVFSLSGKTKISYLSKGQKATKLYLIGNRCVILFDTKSGKNSAAGLVNYHGSKF